LNYAWDINFKNFSSLAINVAGASPATTLASEVASKLNANAIFAEMFVAQVTPLVPHQPTFPHVSPNTYTVLIVPKPGRIKPNIKLWISNSSAEIPLRFNLKTGISEMPTYMDRHTIENRFIFPDSQGCLIHLDESNPDDEAIIEAAGFDPGAMLEDWQLLAGRSGIFNFQKLTVDGSDRITEIIEYPAGAKKGDFARKIAYSYTGANKNPDQITEIPYTLTNSDLVTP